MMNELGGKMISKAAKKLFAIGDIHGCNDELNELLARLPLDNGSQIIFLGDYIDRGPESKEVINTIINLQKKYNVITLMGNHEKMFLDFLQNRNTAEAGAFLYNGGTTTLGSYSDNYGNYEFPEEHIDFLNGLKLYYETDEYFFVHAGVPNIPIDDIKEGDYEDDFLWIREPFLESKFEWKKMIIHGHTPVTGPILTPYRVNIDTGCVYEGKLSAIEIPRLALYSVPSFSRQRTTPFRKTGDCRRKSVRFDVIMPVFIELNNEKVKFETINYSDYGMLIKSSPSSNHNIAPNQEFSGVIGTAKNVTHFKGILIRSERKSTGIFYAIKFTETPSDFLAKLER